MENKSHALAAGTFVLALLALVVALAVWLMHDRTEPRVFEISSAFSVSGLQIQASVRYKGVPVGRVTAIGLDARNAGNVLVRIAVNTQVPVTQATFASLGFQGVTGLAFIQLDDDGGAGPALQDSASVPARIPMRAGTLARWTDQGEQLLGQLKQGSTRVNDLLAPDNQKILMQAVSSLGRAAASLQQLSDRVDRTLQAPAGEPSLNLPRLASQVDASFRSMQTMAEHLSVSADDVRSSATEFRKASVRMTEPDGTLDRIARNAETIGVAGQAVSNTLVPRLNRATDDAARTVRQLGQMADTLAGNPQALIFGSGAPAPGPGEAGFVAPPAQ